jgi:hypothetical protein
VRKQNTIAELEIRTIIRRNNNLKQKSDQVTSHRFDEKKQKTEEPRTKKIFLHHVDTIYHFETNGVKDFLP